MKVVHSSPGPILRLPPETLSEIFSHYIRTMRNSRAPFPHRYRLSESLGYLKIAHVCHHWREVSLESSKLWSHIDLGPLEVTQELLARSKSTSLAVVAHDKYASSDSLILMFKAFPRIREIKLKLNTQQYIQLASSLPENAPHLRKVSIYNPCSTGSSGLPGIFDECTPPSLEDLHIDIRNFPRLEFQGSPEDSGEFREISLESNSCRLV